MSKPRLLVRFTLLPSEYVECVCNIIILNNITVFRKDCQKSLTAEKNFKLISIQSHFGMKNVQTNLFPKKLLFMEYHQKKINHNFSENFVILLFLQTDLYIN